VINLYDILEAGDGQLFGDVAAVLFPDFCYDSRRVKPGELFVAVRTERGDGHGYIREALEGGAQGIMCQRPPDFDTTGLTVIVMRDVETALLRWAEVMLRKHGTTVIAVTGSAGKSTTKEMIAAILGTRYNVFRSPGSYNGAFGLPLALGKLSADHKIAVLEFGADHYGEVGRLVEVTKPLVGVVTNIQHAYTDRLTSLDVISTEHAALIESLSASGLAILNYDDDRVRRMGGRTKSSVMTYGLDLDGRTFGADLIAFNLVMARDKVGFDLRFDRNRLLGKWIPFLGMHHLYNALAALLVGTAYDIALDEGLRALTEMSPLPGRMRPLEGRGGALLVDDTVNANPETCLAALDWLDAMREAKGAGRFICIFGDLDDLGGYTTPGHRAIGRRAAEVADELITKGETAALIGRAALDHGMEKRRVRITFSAEDAANAVGDLRPDDVVLIKGSPSARMEMVTNHLLIKARDADQLVRQEPAYNTVWLDRPTRPTWIEVDKGAIAGNVRRVRQIIGDKVGLMAVIKANAYGHGAVAVASTALNNGATYLGVASVNEAIDLREAALDVPILVLGYTPIWAVRQALRYNLTLCLYDAELARAYDRVAREMNAALRVHVKVDTGMTRLGLLPEEVMPFFRTLKPLTNLEVEGMFTHFAASESIPNYTRGQLSTFEALIAPLRASGFRFKYLHAANTAAALTLPETRLDMVRVGIGLYGLNPAPDAPLPDGFRPALSWKTTLAQVKQIPSGTYVGYGSTYRTRGTERIAVIPVGYADGFRRAPRTFGEVLVGGKRAAIIGRVSMDMTMINVTDIADVQIGDEVVLIGRQGEQKITAEDVAKALDTSVYEVVSTILARVPRL